MLPRQSFDWRWTDRTIRFAVRMREGRQETDRQTAGRAGFRIGKKKRYAKTERMHRQPSISFTRKSRLFGLQEFANNKAYRERGGKAPLILKFGTRWRWVVSLMLRLLYPWRQSPSVCWIRSWKGPRAGLDALVRIETGRTAQLFMKEWRFINIFVLIRIIRRSTKIKSELKLSFNIGAQDLTSVLWIYKIMKTENQILYILILCVLTKWMCHIRPIGSLWDSWNSSDQFSGGTHFESWP
jgi:hypothetical protein